MVTLAYVEAKVDAFQENSEEGHRRLRKDLEEGLEKMEHAMGRLEDGQREDHDTLTTLQAQLADDAAKRDRANAFWRWSMAALVTALFAVIGILYNSIDTRLHEQEQGRLELLRSDATQRADLATVIAIQQAVMKQMEANTVKLDTLLERHK